LKVVLKYKYLYLNGTQWIDENLIANADSTATAQQQHQQQDVMKSEWPLSVKDLILLMNIHMVYRHLHRHQH